MCRRTVPMLTLHRACKATPAPARHGDTADKQVLNEARLRDVIQSQPITVGEEDFQLWLVGLSETDNHATLIAIAIGGIDERLQLQLSDDWQSETAGRWKRPTISNPFTGA